MFLKKFRQIQKFNFNTKKLKNGGFCDFVSRTKKLQSS